MVGNWETSFIFPMKKTNSGSLGVFPQAFSDVEGYTHAMDTNIRMLNSWTCKNCGFTHRDSTGKNWMLINTLHGNDHDELWWIVDIVHGNNPYIHFLPEITLYWTMMNWCTDVVISGRSPRNSENNPGWLPPVIRRRFAGEMGGASRDRIDVLRTWLEYELNMNYPLVN